MQGASGAGHGDGAASHDVRIHDFPVTRWLWGKLRGLARRRHAGGQVRRFADLPEHTLYDLGLSDRDVGGEQRRRYWYL